MSTTPAGEYLLARRLRSAMPACQVCDVDSVKGGGQGLRKAVCDAATQLAVGQKFEERFWSITTKNKAHTKFPGSIKGLQWCGIYAVWVWNQALIDMDWELNTPQGNSNGPYKPGAGTRIKTSTDLTHLAPGDILVKIKPYLHHMIVISTSLEDAPLKLEVLQGNSGTGDETQTIVSRAAVDRSGGEYYFYSLDSVDSASVNYGGNTPGSR
jgi:hypothetical protein